MTGLSKYAQAMARASATIARDASKIMVTTFEERLVTAVDNIRAPLTQSISLKLGLRAELQGKKWDLLAVAFLTRQPQTQDGTTLAEKRFRTFQ